MFELTPPATARGSWTESVLWNFGAGTDGNQPKAGLIMDAERQSLWHHLSRRGFRQLIRPRRDGVRADTSRLGRRKLDRVNPLELWQRHRRFNPRAGLIMDNSGNLYGTTFNGGSDSMGTVFELTPPGGSWTESVLLEL